MNSTSKLKINLSIADALLIATFWGGAWVLGFLLGFG
jgi:hypothetical protein